MQDFDSLKNIWQQPTPADKNPAMIPIGKNSTTLKMKLQKQQLGGAVMLVLTAILIAAMAIFGGFNFTHWYTYGGMVLICTVCLAQAGLMFSLYKKISNIDETVSPTAHLQQWEAYYDLRKKQNKWNMPLYYILLNIAMGIYLIEVFTGRPLVNVSIFIAVYIAWMLFAYFYLGKKNIRKEDIRLNSIVEELKLIERQLMSAE
jgi:hypothetical protein